MAQGITEIIDKLEQLNNKFIQNLSQVKNDKQLEEIRIKYLGRKGELASFFSLLGKLTAEERPEAGKKLNILKKRFQEGR